jgi:hypothetical protein
MKADKIYKRIVELEKASMREIFSDEPYHAGFLEEYEEEIEELQEMLKKKIKKFKKVL